MYDFSPKPQILAPPEWKPEPQPTQAELLVDAVREGVVHPVRGLADLATRMLLAPSRVTREVAAVIGGLREVIVAGVLAPPSPFKTGRFGRWFPYPSGPRTSGPPWATGSRRSS